MIARQNCIIYGRSKNDIAYIRSLFVILKPVFVARVIKTLPTYYVKNLDFSSFLFISFTFSRQLIFLDASLENVSSNILFPFSFLKRMFDWKSTAGITVSEYMNE
jgi:hypothetical protein